MMLPKRLYTMNRFKKFYKNYQNYIIKNYKIILNNFLGQNFFGDDGFQNMFVYQLKFIKLDSK